MKGYIKLHRIIEESSIFSDANLFKTFAWCLIRATYKARKVMIGSSEIELTAGQLVTGRKSASIALGISESLVRSHFKTLQKVGAVKLEATNKYTILTIVNWDKYQNDEPENETEKPENTPTKNQAESTKNATLDETKITEINQQNANETPAENQQNATNKKEKNIRNKELKENNNNSLSLSLSQTENRQRLKTQMYSQEFKEVANMFEQHYGLLNTHTIMTLSNCLINGLEPTLIHKALEIAVGRDANSPQYALTICENWSKKGIKTLADYENSPRIGGSNNYDTYQRNYREGYGSANNQGGGTCNGESCQQENREYEDDIDGLERRTGQKFIITEDMLECDF